MRQLHAYFIGGPMDLTKQAISESLDEIYFSVPDRHTRPYRYSTPMADYYLDVVMITYRRLRHNSRNQNIVFYEFVEV